MQKILQNLKKTIQNSSQGTKNISNKGYKKTLILIQKWPLLSLIIMLAILFVLIALSNTIFKPKATDTNKVQTIKNVSVYKIGANPIVQTQAVVEKSGVIKIVSLSGGIVQQINVAEGDTVKKGTNLAWFSTNYQGGNAASAQRSLAQTQYNNVLQTFNTQKDLIQKQRDLANKTDENSDQMRDINSKSSFDTNYLINLNQSMINQLNNNLKNLEQNNVGGVNDAAILEVKGGISQLEGGNLQLRNSQRNTDYSVAGDKPPAQISDIQKDITLKQLDIQEKALDLQKEVSRLQVVIAGIQEAMYHPVAPFSGKVDRIYVRRGEAVNPGTPIMEITSSDKSMQAVVLASSDLVNKVSTSMPSFLNIDGEKIEVLPLNISLDATDGALHSIIFPIPEYLADKVSDKAFITVELTLIASETLNEKPFVPVDSIYQSQSEAFLFVAEKGEVKTKKIKLGKVLGGFVTIESGLTDGDQVILDRNIIAGDKVKIIN